MDAATQRLATHANYIHLKNTPRTATWTHLRSNNQSLFIHTASLTIKIVSRRIEQREMKVIYESVPPAPDAAPVEENEKLQKVVMTEKS